MRFIQRLSVLVCAAVVALALFCQPQMRADAALMTMDDPIPAGPQLDCLVACAIGQPIDGYKADCTGYPEFCGIFAPVPMTIEYYWQIRKQWEIWGELPPGTTVVCGVAPVEYSTDLGNARDAADLAGYEWGEGETAEEICNGIVELVGGNNP
jgi:hypothetical protein